jgi:toxin ParE1/3/4
LDRVVFAVSAKADLDAIFTWIADHASEDIAGSYVARIRGFCEEIPPFPLRGTKRDDLRAGLRTMGFERRATIAFTVMGEDVIILRVLDAGRSIELAFGESH